MKFTRRKEVKQKITAAMSSTADLAKTLDRNQHRGVPRICTAQEEKANRGILQKEGVI